MHFDIAPLLEARISTDKFEATRVVSDDDISELVRLATLAPSAYNFQNWTFTAVRSPGAKQRLQAVAYGQQKLVDAAVTFIVCGTLQAHLQLQQTLAPSIEAGILPPALVDGWVSAADRSHSANPQLQRDEALRSASLAGMTLMLAAQGMGLASCPMSGFDAGGVAREFGLASDEVPVMLVAVGKAAAGNWPRKVRKPVAEVLTFA